MALQIETWFPLTVCYEDLQLPAGAKAGMLAHLQPWIDRHRAAEAGRYAFTGDRSGCWQLHEVEAFRWIRSQVERRAIEYAKVLGLDLSILGFHFQRAWPVMSRKGEMVSRHLRAHASMSAVYFLASPSDLAAAGRLVLHNQAEQSSLGHGFGLEDTAGIREWNPLNYHQTGYRPLEGRLLLFPARQPHSVEPNQTDELRISLAFDIALTCSSQGNPGEHEFLVPPPEEWSEFGSQIVPDGEHPEENG